MPVNQAAFDKAVNAANHIHDGPSPPSGWNQNHYRKVYRAAIETYMGEMRILSSCNPFTIGPVIKWTNYGVEGWKPESYNSLEEAVLSSNYGNNFIITRKIDYKVIVSEKDKDIE